MPGLRLFIVGAALVACACNPKPAATLTASESWCPDGFEVGPQDTCFAVPERTTKETPVLVYLHGMFRGHGSDDEWRLVRGAVARGFAVVVPRGKRGACAWKAELADHFCWPGEPEDVHAFKSVVAEWERVLWQVDAILEAGSHKRYVLGFSNGGFFAAYIAAHGLFPAAAIAIVNAGPLGAADTPQTMPPVLLLRADGDAGSQNSMSELRTSFEQRNWPHAYCTRAGSHALASEDVETALRFFRRDPASSATEFSCTEAVAGTNTK
jgi:poly(3-hydroxybutyrate) depolymerase